MYLSVHSYGPIVNPLLDDVNQPNIRIIRKLVPKIYLHVITYNAIISSDE